MIEQRDRLSFTIDRNIITVHCLIDSKLFLVIVHENVCAVVLVDVCKHMNLDKFVFISVNHSL